MLGGSTDLIKVENRYEGDLSGILTKNIPKWFSRFYKPGYKISNIRDWATKLEQITINAHKWDIGIIAGVPAWVQILLEKIVAHYNVKDIHEIWPNLQLFIHGGVSFAPYKNSLSKYLGKEIYFLETYLASEGFLAFRHADENAMKLVLNNGIYFEFVPFNGKNFTDEGNLVENPEILKLDQVQECIEYALLISTCSGAWRYLIGDTIKFTSLERYDIVITGRTKHFLSMCGEHLSVDNMNKAIKTISEEENIIINEFTVAGISYDNLFAHKWFLAIDTEVDKLLIKDKLDKCLAKLNDDYGVERKAALKEVIVEVVPTKYFYEWMRLKGKEGAQNKFPRVMKKDQFEDWENFIFKNKS
ncbi:MAG: hypothetical protein A2265_04850 [Bacteroidetes bacterium RIFOXYA12_FULL_33_9]|nr:MAG: hypothetical protein A2265_04850 [Bacteroidetes bacterium RIFOXYA12_FULL_33_9]